jgi:hypothetical protein
MGYRRLRTSGIRRRRNESLAAGMIMDVSEVLSMVYFCDLGTGAWVGYFSGSGLTDCEWLIPGTVRD